MKKLKIKAGETPTVTAIRLMMEKINELVEYINIKEIGYPTDEEEEIADGIN